MVEKENEVSMDLEIFDDPNLVERDAKNAPEGDNYDAS